MQLTLMGAKSNASCCVRLSVVALIAASIAQPLAIGFSQIDPVVNVMDDERSSFRYRAPIFSCEHRGECADVEGLLHLFQTDLFQRYCRQPLTSHEDDVIDIAHLFK